MQFYILHKHIPRKTTPFGTNFRNLKNIADPLMVKKLENKAILFKVISEKVQKICFCEFTN